MKKIILLLTLLLATYINAKNITGAYAIGIFDSFGNGENIQNARKTRADYNNTCYTKIFVIGTILRTKPEVKIGNSIGHFQSSKPIYNKSKIKIGEVMIFKHYAVSSGLIRVTYRNRLFDSKVFVK